MKRVLGVLATAVVASVIVGLVLGGTSRLLMRVITVAAKDDAEFSVSGTFFILLAYAMFMLPGALLAAASRRRWRSALLVLGALALCVPAASIAKEELGSTTGFSGGQWAVIVGVSAGIFAAIAAMPALTTRVVDRLQRRWLG